MAEYQSAYTGPQIDAAIAKANTAAQPEDLASKQDILVSGTNIKTINNLSLLGSGNIDIQGGGGGDDVRIIDATDPADWEGEGPTQACLLDVLSHAYQIIYIENIPSDVPGMVYGVSMHLLSVVDVDEDGSEYHLRQYVRFDSDDGEDPYIQEFVFSKEGDNDAEMDVEQYPLGGDTPTTTAPIYFKNFAGFVDGVDGQCKFSIYQADLADISNAIDSGMEIVIGVNGLNYDDNKYFRLAAFDRNGRTYISEFGESYYLPEFTVETPYGLFTAEYDSFDSGSNDAVFYRFYEGTKKYQPTDIKLSTNSITFDSDDLNQIWTQKRAEITVNVDEGSSTNWVAFKKTAQDDTYNAESITWTSDIIIDSSHLFVYKLAFANNQGTIETSIYKYELTANAV